MTIRRGEPWGDVATTMPADTPRALDDRAASHLVEGWRRAGRAVVPVGLAAGDMARTVGGGAEGRLDGPHVRATIDLLRISADGRELWAVAHVVARRSWWRGEVVLAMNAQFLGPYDVAPRSHPNDGRVDVFRVDERMSVRDRLAARRRARTGTHLPHPGIQVSVTDEWTATFDRPLELWVDGTRCGSVRELAVVVVPDALVVHA